MNCQRITCLQLLRCYLSYTATDNKSPDHIGHHDNLHVLINNGRALEPCVLSVRVAQINAVLQHIQVVCEHLTVPFVVLVVIVDFNEVLK